MEKKPILIVFRVDVGKKPYRVRFLRWWRKKYPEVPNLIFHKKPGTNHKEEKEKFKAATRAALLELGLPKLFKIWLDIRRFARKQNKRWKCRTGSGENFLGVEAQTISSVLRHVLKQHNMIKFDTEVAPDVGASGEHLTVLP